MARLDKRGVMSPDIFHKYVAEQSNKDGWAGELGVGRRERGEEKEDVGAGGRHGESRTRKKALLCA